MWFAQRFFEVGCVSSFGDIDVFCLGPTFMAACMPMMPIYWHFSCMVAPAWLEMPIGRASFTTFLWDGLHLQKGFAHLFKKQIRYNIYIYILYIYTDNM